MPASFVYANALAVEHRRGDANGEEVDLRTRSLEPASQRDPDGVRLFHR
jgi:hypothetical protein